MNPLYQKLFGTPAKENLVDQAIAANNSEGTTDPEQAQQNVDFHAEIQKLKEANGQGAAAPEPAPEPTPEPSPEPTAEPTPEPQASEEPEDDDIEDATAEGEAATESLLAVARSLEAIHNTHNTGVVTERHVNLVEQALEFNRRSVGIRTAPRVSTENDAPTSSAGRVKYVAGRVRDFVRELLAKIQEHLAKIKRWIADFFRGWRESRGRFEANTAGLIKRIKHVRDNARSAAEIKEAAHANALTNARFLMTETDQAPTIESIEKGVEALSAVTAGMGHFVMSEQGLYALTLPLANFNHERPANSVLQGDNGITPAGGFAIRGATSAFGSNRDVYNNMEERKADRDGMVELVISKLLGCNDYVWRLAEDQPTTLDQIIHLNNGYNFSVRSPKLLAQVDLLTSVDECTSVMGVVAELMSELEKVSNIEKTVVAGEEKFSKFAAAVKDYVSAADVEEETLVKIMTVYSSGQNAFSNLALTMVSQHARLLGMVIETLQRWVAESLNIIDKGVELKTGK